eukprot:7524168-Lingulodinium_polyedra.AAC.1
MPFDPRRNGNRPFTELSPLGCAMHSLTVLTSNSGGTMCQSSGTRVVARAVPTVPRRALLI